MRTVTFSGTCAGRDKQKSHHNPSPVFALWGFQAIPNAAVTETQNKLITAQCIGMSLMV